MRERGEWSCGSSDIEGKATRVGASECGQRTSFNRTREAGNRDEVEGVVASTLNAFQCGAVGFIDWLGRMGVTAQLPELPEPRVIELVER